MSEEKKPGKKRKYQLPTPVTWTISVLDDYDPFFREKLLDAVRDDLENFTGGIVLFHRRITEIVDDYAGEIVNSAVLDVRDLSNFLKGMKSRTERIQILDAYIQITKPETRKKFFANRYIENLGDTLVGYIGERDSSNYDQARRLQRLIGVYTIATVTPYRDPDDEPLRYFVIRQHKSPNYFVCYDFSPEEEALDLWTGICIPRGAAIFILMRDLRGRDARVGKIFEFPRLPGFPQRTWREAAKKGRDAVVTFSDTAPWKLQPRKKYSTYSRISPAHIPASSNWKNKYLDRVFNDSEERKVQEAVNRFGDVF